MLSNATNMVNKEEYKIQENAVWDRGSDHPKYGISLEWIIKLTSSGVKSLMYPYPAKAIKRQIWNEPVYLW